MTPEAEKAKELIKSYSEILENNTQCFNIPAVARQCALTDVCNTIDIANRVSDISGNYFRVLPNYNYGDADQELKFWQGVQKELLKMQ